MAEIVVVVDSGADVPQEEVERHGIVVVPMHVTFGEVSKPDGSFDHDEIVQYYEKTGSIPKTSGGTPHDFEVAFDEITAARPGAHIVYLAYSAVTTASFKSAEIAAQGRDNITLIDTKYVTVGQGEIAVRLCEHLEQHPEWTTEEAIAEANRLCKQATMSFLPTNLKYLVAGGRLTNAAAFAGTVLRVRPRIDLENGYLVATSKYRGRMDKVVNQYLNEFCKDLDREEIWIALSPRVTDEVKNAIVQTLGKLGFERIRWAKCGGVISTHGGPNAFAVAGFKAE